MPFDRPLSNFRHEISLTTPFDWWLDCSMQMIQRYYKLGNSLFNYYKLQNVLVRTLWKLWLVGVNRRHGIVYFSLMMMSTVNMAAAPPLPLNRPLSACHRALSWRGVHRTLVDIIINITGTPFSRARSIPTPENQKSIPLCHFLPRNREK